MSYEDQGTAYDPDASGHELQGRRAKPVSPRQFKAQLDSILNKQAAKIARTLYRKVSTK